MMPIRGKRNEYRGTAGYFTVEAALIFPIVLAVILGIIYLWFFQYDRCLQDMQISRSCLRAVSEPDLTPEERAAFALQLTKADEDLFAAWAFAGRTVSFEKGELRLEAFGYVDFPFPALWMGSGSGRLEAKSEASGKLRSRVFLIRTYRKAAGKIGNLLGEK